MNQEAGRSVRLSPFHAHDAMRNTEPAHWPAAMLPALAKAALDAQAGADRAEKGGAQ